MFHKLPPLIENIEVRISIIKSMKDITTEDLDNLVDIVKEIERLDAREWAFVEHNKCPYCGNNIVETQYPVGGTPDEPPDAIIWRVGCEKCEFVVASETY